MNSREVYTQKASRRAFKLIPDHIIQDMATRKFNMGSNSSCVCGWAFKAGIQDLIDNGEKERAEDIKNPFNTQHTNSGCRSIYGGRKSDWNEIYCGVLYSVSLPIIELEFVRRVNRAATK